MMGNEVAKVVAGFLLFGVCRPSSVSIAFSPNRGNAIWVDSNDAVNTSWTTPVETVSKVRFDSLNNLKRGPHCFACAGKECVIPRRKHEHSALTCGSGEVCWTVETIEFGSEPETNYFRGCGAPDLQKCAGNRRQRPPARSTAGQRLEVNGEQYCQWSSSVSQCRSCCVTDHCNGASFVTLANDAIKVLNSGGTSHWIKLHVELSTSTGFKSGRWLAVALLLWSSWFAAFPPSNFF